MRNSEGMSPVLSIMHGIFIAKGTHLLFTDWVASFLYMNVAEWKDKLWKIN